MKLKRIVALAIAVLMVAAMLPMRAVAADEDITDKFPDASFREIIRGLLEIDDDAPIMKSEAERFLELTCYYTGIKDYSGIEYLTNLVKLTSYANNVAVLDLSRNTKLEYVMSWNDGVTELNVGGCTELVELSCYGLSTKLTALDVTKNTKLEYLYVYGNELQELDLSKNSDLTYLACGGNLLTEIDLRENTKLLTLLCGGNILSELDLRKQTELEHLDCNSNELVSLDVSACANLEELHCGDNQIKSLDVKNSPYLTDLSCNYNSLTKLDVSRNTELWKLNCVGNELTEIDLTKNTNLAMVYVSYNKIRTIDLSKNANLAGFGGHSNELTTIDFSNNPRLWDVDLRYNCFSDRDAIKGMANTKITDETLKFDGQRTPEPGSVPSSWAAASVNAAIAAGIVPAALQSKYTTATTRAEFCALAVALYETKLGAITERAKFDDTTDVNVEKMAALGVVNGTGEGKFSPNSQLTREQAATMLARLADAMDSALPTTDATPFADGSAVASWASSAVAQMQASGIMGGVGDNKFSPKGSYTREQSILTIMRLYDYVK